MFNVTKYKEHNHPIHNSKESLHKTMLNIYIYTLEY